MRAYWLEEGLEMRNRVGDKSSGLNIVVVQRRKDL